MSTVQPAPDFVVPARQRRTAPRHLWLVPLVLLVATEYKIRRRGIQDALSGRVDTAIILELGLFALIGLAVYVLAGRTRVRWVPLTVLVAGYALTTAVSAAYAPFPRLAAARGVQLVIIALAMIVLANRGDRGTMGRVVDGYIVLITASIGVGLAYVAPVPRNQVGRFTWLSTHSVISGALLAVSVVLITARLLGRPTSRGLGPFEGFLGRRMLVVLLCVHAVFLLRTQTRSSVAAAIAGCLVIVWLRVAPRLRPQLAGMVLLVGAAGALVAGGAVVAYLDRGEGFGRFATLNRRTEIWSLAWDSFLARPVSGRGFTAASGVFYDAVAQGGERPLGGAHNAFVEVITDVGLIGLVWWIGLVGSVVVGVVRLHRRHGAVVDVAALAGLMTCLLVNAITIEGLGAGVSAPFILLTVAAAWLVICEREERSSGPSAAGP